LQVEGVGRVAADAVVIATGSSPTYPDAWNALGDRLISNEHLFSMQDLPRSVAVFGPGVIGLELGQALHRLGVRVKVFGRGGGIGPLADRALQAYARKVFGEEFYLDTDASTVVSRDSDQVRVDFTHLDGRPVTEHFDYLLAATGRAPNVEGLGLENTTLQLDASGVPVFDRFTMRCGVAPIFIAGDVNNDVPLLHEAVDEGHLAGLNAGRFPDVHPGRRRAGLAVVFSDPQIAVVGGGYLAARGTAHVIGEASFEDQGRARVMLRNRGMLHIYAAANSGRFIGAEMIGPDAEHIAHLLAWALQLGLTVAQMLELPFYHPVVEEGLRTALRDAQARIDANTQSRLAA
jgi:dihydrolipoamide dehydrogenase